MRNDKKGRGVKGGKGDERKGKENMERNLGKLKERNEMDRLGDKEKINERKGNETR